MEGYGAEMLWPFDQSDRHGNGRAGPHLCEEAQEVNGWISDPLSCHSRAQVTCSLAWRKFESAMIRIPSHSLQTGLMKISGPFGELYKMVVAVSTRTG